MSITFIVTGPPQGKDRPRFTRAGHAYTTRKSAYYERLIRKTYRVRYFSKPLTSDEPVIMESLTCFPVPRMDSRKMKQMVDAKEQN